MNIEEKINDLKNKLKKWEYEYYAMDNPTISDFQYDMTLQELIKLEDKYPDYKTNDSPSVRVGGFISKKFKKVKHNTSMLSLSNAFNKDALIKFNNDIKSELSNDVFFSYSVESKIDGLSIALIYKDGFLFQALTRGDGIEGENVIQNVKTIKSIPLSIPYKKEIEVRGEIFFNKIDIQKLNKKIEKKFSNARNAAAGTIRNLDSSIVSQRNLNAIIYNIPEALEHNLKTQEQVIKWLSKNKFNISKETVICNSIDDVFKQIEWFNLNKEKIKYDIDGIVIKINEISLYEDIGYTSKFPKWAIAYKFPPEIGITKLLDIITSVGRTGRINYTALVEKVKLNDTVVQNATLHNYDYINSKDIRINDYVSIFKAGEIIPKIIGPIINKRNGHEIIFNIPKYCPSCNSKLHKEKEEVDLYCINNNCNNKIIELMNHFVSRQAMNIDGLSIKIIEKLYNKKIICNIIDIYSLNTKKEKIINLKINIKEKSINNLIKNINFSKNNSLEKLIFGLGIRHIGEIASKELAKKYLSLHNLRKASLDDLSKLNDLGEKMAISIVEYFNNKNNQEIIDNLIKLKIAINYYNSWSDIKIKKENLKFKNTKIVITGSFSNSRNNIKSILQDLYGIKISSKVTPSIDYIIIGNNPTIKKIEESKKYKIEIIDKEFWK